MDARRADAKEQGSAKGSDQREDEGDYSRRCCGALEGEDPECEQKGVQRRPEEGPGAVEQGRRDSGRDQAAGRDPGGVVAGARVKQPEGEPRYGRQDEREDPPAMVESDVIHTVT